MSVKGSTMKICLIALLGFGAVALAQRPGRNFEGGFRGLFQGKVVTNEPYSGVGVSTSKRTLADGNTINESNCVKVYRDSSGRTRREETRNSPTCGATRETISDQRSGGGRSIRHQRAKEHLPPVHHQNAARADHTAHSSG